MDFGALFCKPKNPDCFNCPFKNECIAFRDETVSIIPYKSKKIKRSKRYFHYFVITFGDKVYINKRLNNDIWKGLFEFPLIETKRLSLKNPMIQFESVINLKGFIEEVEKVETLELAKHVLSHQDLFVTLHKYRIKATSREIKMPYKLVELNNLKNFAFPRVLTKNMDFILYK
jgi:A/G-specific adenine glycosylase